MRWMQASSAAAVAAIVLAAAPGAPAAIGRAAVAYRSEADLTTALRRAPATVVRRLPALHVVEVRPHTSLAALRRQPGIEAVERPAPRASRVEPALATLPNSASEWQFQAAREDTVPEWVQRAAQGITIAVIDTGADLTAPDLAAKQPGAYDIRSQTTDVRDANGHGTFVASLAGGSVTNAEGIAGFGGDARLLVVRAGRADGSFSDVDEAAGIVYAVDHGAKIVNLSLGGPDTSSVERRAIDYAVAHGVLIVAAAGNERERGNPVEYPAALLQQVGSNGSGGVGLSVGASAPGGVHASFSNTGTWISLAAPGVGVLGAVSALSSPALYPRVPLPGSEYGLYGLASGTSFAAPEVAGAAALVWAADPSLDAQAVARILKESASGGGLWTPELGFGVIDVGAAVARATGAPGVVVTAAAVRSRLHLTWTGTAPAYRVSLQRDGAAPRVLVASTTKNEAWFTLARGHAYVFTVTALGADGSELAGSIPLRVRR